MKCFIYFSPVMVFQCSRCLLFIQSLDDKLGNTSSHPTNELSDCLFANKMAILLSSIPLW